MMYVLYNDRKTAEKNPHQHGTNARAVSKSAAHHAQHRCEVGAGRNWDKQADGAVDRLCGAGGGR